MIEVTAPTLARTTQAAPARPGAVVDGGSAGSPRGMVSEVVVSVPDELSVGRLAPPPVAMVVSVEVIPETVVVTAWTTVPMACPALAASILPNPASTFRGLVPPDALGAPDGGAPGSPARGTSMSPGCVLSLFGADQPGVPTWATPSASWNGVELAAFGGEAVGPVAVVAPGAVAATSTTEAAAEPRALADQG